MAPLHNTKRRLYFIVFAVLFVLMVPAVLVLAFGYRFDSHWRLVPTGGIALTGVDSNVEIYINYKPQQSSSFFQDSFFIKDLVPGTYFVVAAEEGHWSWAKYINVTEGQVTSVPVLSLAQHPKLQPVTPTIVQKSIVDDFDFFASSTAPEVANPEYPIVQALFAIKPIAPLSSSTPVVNGNVEAWLSGPGNQVLTVSWLGDISTAPAFFCVSGSCRTSVISYASNFPVKTAAFFPSRNDVMLLQLADGLYAVELDQSKVQNYQPVYLGNNFDFRIGADNDLYIKQNGDYYEVEL